MRRSRTYFLTSEPLALNEEEEPVLNPANGFVDALFEFTRPRGGLLFIASDPDQIEGTEEYADRVFRAFANSGYDFPDCAILDSRNTQDTDMLLRDCGVIFLAGGHVPTENRFFRSIDLRRRLHYSRASIVGASAGSMNCADTVYACPEYAEEAVNPRYRRFRRGLGITTTMMIPHFAGVMNEERGGLRVLDEICLPDSVGRTFVGVPDGSFIIGHHGEEEICGEAWILSDGEIEAINTPELSEEEFSEEE